MQELCSVLFKRQFDPLVDPRQNTTQQQQTTSQPVKSYEHSQQPRLFINNILQALPAATNVPTQYGNDSVSSYETGDLFRRSMNCLAKTNVLPVHEWSLSQGKTSLKSLFFILHAARVGQSSS